MTVQVNRELVEQLVADAGEDAEILGRDGLLAELTKSVLETALAAELTSHVGYERGDVKGNGSGNSRRSCSRWTRNHRFRRWTAPPDAADAARHA